tara:strand:- start:396 stop:551 length:156 start_codon:yes stop_codon:yes gene_type:complete
MEDFLNELWGLFLIIMGLHLLGNPYKFCFDVALIICGVGTCIRSLIDKNRK